MANTVFGPYTKTNWTAGVTALNQTNMLNLETQASVALHGFNPDFTAGGFVYSGCAVTGTVGTTTVNIASGSVYVTMSDGTTGLITVGATTQTTSALSSTYHLYVQPDGTFYWSTSNTPAANSVALANVLTNGSGQISSITDQRATGITIYPNMLGNITIPNYLVTGQGIYVSGGAASASAFQGSLYYSGGNSAIALASPLGGAGSTGIYFATKNSGSTVIPVSFGGQYGSASTWVGNSGNVGAVAGQATAGSFGVPMIIAQDIDHNITVTTQVTLISVSISQGLYRFSGSMYNAGTGGNAQPNLIYSAPGGHASYTWSAHGALWNDTSITSMNGTATVLSGSNDWVILPEVAYLKAGTLTVKYTNTIGSPNDNITVIVERLA